MTPPPIRRLDLPDHWSAEQALAVFEFIDLLRDHIWACYGPAIQHALCEDQRSSASTSSPQAPDDPPF
jgi:hypothetical protein